MSGPRRVPGGMLGIVSQSSGAAIKLPPGWMLVWFPMSGGPATAIGMSVGRLAPDWVRLPTAPWAKLGLTSQTPVRTSSGATGLRADWLEAAPAWASTHPMMGHPKTCRVRVESDEDAPLPSVTTTQYVAVKPLVYGPNW